MAWLHACTVEGVICAYALASRSYHYSYAYADCGSACALVEDHSHPVPSDVHIVAWLRLPPFFGSPRDVAWGNASMIIVRLCTDGIHCIAKARLVALLSATDAFLVGFCFICWS